MVLVNAFLLQLYQPLNFLGVVYRELRQSLTDLENMMGLLGLRAGDRGRAGCPAAAARRRRVALRGRGASTTTARRPILTGVSFTIPAGHKLAVVGRSGSGKSTLVRLLFRFYEVDRRRDR